MPIRRATAALAAAMLLAACGATPQQAATTTRKTSPASRSQGVGSTQAAHPTANSTAAAKAKATQLIPLRFSFDFIANGEDAPFYAAKDEGFYRAQGLDVTLVKGVNATDATQWVASGKVDLTYDAAGSAAEAITKGAPLDVLAVTIQRDPLGLIYRADHPLRQPSDLYGQTVGVPPGTDAAILWKAFATDEHLNLSRIHVADVSPATEAGLLGERKIAAFSAYGYLFVPRMGQLGVPAGFLAYGHYGVPSMTESIVTTTAMLKNHPNRVRRFLHATAQGWAFSEAHPAQAVADLRRADPQLNPKVSAEQLTSSFAYLHSANTKGKPWGWQSAADWKTEVAFLHKYYGVKHPLPVDSYFTNAYLPAGPVKP